MTRSTRLLPAVLLLLLTGGDGAAYGAGRSGDLHRQVLRRRQRPLLAWPPVRRLPVAGLRFLAGSLPRILSMKLLIMQTV